MISEQIQDIYLYLLKYDGCVIGEFHEEHKYAYYYEPDSPSLYVDYVLACKDDGLINRMFVAFNIISGELTDYKYEEEEDYGQSL